MSEQTPSPEDYYLAVGPELKLKRCLEHLGVLQAATQIYAESNAFAIALERDAETGDHIVKIKVRDQPSPDIGLILADCIHNLRQALDHAAYSMAVLISGSNPPPNELTAGFPIHNSRGAFKGKIGGKVGSIDQIPRALLNALNDLQPYSGRVGKELAVLRDLDDRAKHRKLPVCIGTVQVKGAGVEGGIVTSLASGPLEVGEAEIARLDAATETDVYVSVRGSFKIVAMFAEDSPAAGQEICAYVDAMRHLIRGEVFAKLTPHLKDLKFPEPE
ncbi:MAG TPA: hypothetical protein VFP21_06315 [Solirubrobacterales bacterium]|nr:hypothetical protein [Solirubrobacterales bacterium]